jgi:hypothetical protein
MIMEQIISPERENKEEKVSSEMLSSMGIFSTYF